MLAQSKSWKSNPRKHDPRIGPNVTSSAEIPQAKRMASRAVHRSLKQRASQYGEALNLSDEIDWGSPEGDEVW